MKVNLIITDIKGYDGEIVIEQTSKGSNTITYSTLDMICTILACDYGLEVGINDFKVRVESLYKTVK